MTESIRFLAKPEPVQIVILMHMVNSSIDDENPDWPDYRSRSMIWWESVHARLLESGLNETAIAERVIVGLRNHEVWHKFLRGKAN